MAMNGNQMGNEVADYILAQAGQPLDGSEQQLVRTFWQGICAVIVDHIATNGRALPGTFKDSADGPLTGKGNLE